MTEEQDNFKAYLPIIEGLKAPREWHEANFIMGKDLPDYKEIVAKREVKDVVTGEVDEIKTPVGFRGAVASGKRQDDGTIIWDWHYEDSDDRRVNLLDFYSIPEMTSLPFYNSESYVPSRQHMDPMPSEENENPLMVWHEDPKPTHLESEEMIFSAAQRMLDDGVDKLTIENFVNDRRRLHRQ